MSQILHPASREEWLGLRTQIISGTDMAAILGKSKYQTPMQVYLQKRGLLDATPETAPMTWGRRMEAFIADDVADLLGVKLFEPGFYRHDTLHVGGTPDRLTEDGQLLIEIKTAGPRAVNDWGEPGTDEIPIPYLLQVHTYLGLTGCTDATVALLERATLRMSLYHVQADAEFTGMLFNAAERFWVDHVEAGNPPPIDASESTGAWLASRLAGRAPSKVLLDATEDIETWASRLQKAQANLKVQTELEQEAKNHLMSLLAEVDGATGSFGKVAWVRSKDRKSVGWQAIADELSLHVPDRTVVTSILNKHTTMKPSTPYLKATWGKETA